MKQLITSLLLIGSFLPFMAQAQDATTAPASGEKYQAGKHYKVIPAPVRTARPRSGFFTRIKKPGRSRVFSGHAQAS